MTYNGTYLGTDPVTGAVNYRYDETAPRGPTFTGRIPGSGPGLGGMGIGGGGGGGGGTLEGAPPRDYDPTHGGVPGVTNPVDLLLGNMGGITNIQTGLTDNAVQLLRNQYGPGYFATLEQLRRNADRRAHGDISDLLPEQWQTNAENAVGGGYSGSAEENTKRLRDMGLTRLGVENQATDSLAKIFGMTPTVHPQDMSGIIGALIQAQMMADIYKSAPNPAAYARSLPTGGGGGGFTGGVRYAPTGSGGAGKVDDILKRMGGNVFGPPIIAKGTKQPDYVSPGATYGGPGDYLSNYGGNINDEAMAGPVGNEFNTDFGGSVGYGGGEPWQSPFGYTPQTGFGGSADYSAGGAYGPMFDPFNTDYSGSFGAPPPPPDPFNATDWGMDPFGGPADPYSLYGV